MGDLVSLSAEVVRVGRTSITVNVAPNAQLSQFIEMPKPAAGTGDLLVRTDPAGARVSVDGQARGTSPVTVAGLAPGTAITLQIQREQRLMYLSFTLD